MKKIYSASLLGAILLFSPVKVSAHCPLCTGGAGAAAAAAAYFGVKYGALGVFLGGFAIALSLWIARLPKKQYFKKQYFVLFWSVFLSTILPFYFMFKGDYVSRYITLGGEYGSITNRTYLIDLFIIGSILGALLVYFSPTISAWLTKARGGRMIKFQGLTITFVLLILGSILLQVWPR